MLFSLYLGVPEYQNRLSIKTWAEEDRPREKLLLKGRRALSDAELIAILLGSGSRDETAVELAKRILAAAKNNLNELARLSVHDLMKYKGIGEAKAISIVSALELGSRREGVGVLIKDRISASGDAHVLLKPFIAGLPHEEFWVIYLNRANKILAKDSVSQGGITGTVADIKLIFKRALDLFATSIILAHNHPSGNLQPSQADINLTRKIKEAGLLLEISVIDHLIISEEGYYSFADEGRM